MATVLDLSRSEELGMEGVYYD